MMFPGTFWKVQNLEIQVQIFENQVQIFEDLKETSRKTAPKSIAPSLEIEHTRSLFRIVWSQIRGFQVRFSKKSAERARFKMAENLSKMEVVGDHRN